MLVLTGRRVGPREFEVQLCGVSVAMHESLYSKLCALVAARLDRQSLAIRIAKSVILRLRRKLDSALGQGEGFRCIWSVPKAKYSLALEPSDIAVDPSFRTFSRTGCLAEGVAEALIHHIGAHDCRENDATEDSKNPPLAV